MANAKEHEVFVPSRHAFTANCQEPAAVLGGVIALGFVQRLHDFAQTLGPGVTLNIEKSTVPALWVSIGISACLIRLASERVRCKPDVHIKSTHDISVL